MTTNQPPDLDIRSLLENGFNEETARKLYEQGEAIVIFALLQLAALALKTNLTGTPCYKNTVNGTVLLAHFRILPEMPHKTRGTL